MTQTVNPPISGSYPGGDTSQTLQIRATYAGPLSLADGVETTIPLFTTVEAGAINLSSPDTTTLVCAKSGTITGAMDLNVHTTGATVTLAVWFEYSADLGSTWAPVPNSLRQYTVATTAVISTPSMLVGTLTAALITRCRIKRTGGTTCVLQADTVATATGNVTQPATLIRIFGI